MTAYKREQKVQDVPIAITTTSRKDIEQRAIDTSNDIERISPNFSAQASGSRSSRPRWFLRGIGSNDPSVNLESPIGVYQDEVYIAYGPLQSFPLFDLERVEVLKGPQGTLWGKNTTGGAIHFVSRKPSFDTSGYAKGTFGSYGTHGAEAGFGGPVIGEWLAARASAYYEEQAGWASNQRDGSKDPQFNDFAARLQLLANLGENVDVLLSGRFRTLNGGVAEVYPVGPNATGQIQQFPTAPTTFTPAYGNNPQAGDSFYRGPGSSVLQSRGATATVNWHIGDYTATSISAIDHANNDALASTNWPDPNFDQAGTYASVQSRQITQELRLTSPKADRFNWIAGFHYFNWNLFSDAASGTFGPAAARKSFIDNRYRQDNVSYAGFASAKFDITKALAVTGGLRYTYDKKYVRVQRASGAGAGLVSNDRSDWFDPDSYGSPLGLVSQKANKGWSQVTFDVTPELHVSKDALVYARFAKGFRAGTFNPAIIPATMTKGAYLPVVNPETLYDWEVGAKTEWLNGRLVANASLFYYLLKDAQLNVQQPNPAGIPGANTSILQNAAGGNIKGVELEVDALPIDELKLHGGLGLLQSEYTDFITFQGASTVDASGNKFYRTPSVSGVVGADYDVPVSKESAVGAGTDWLFRSRIYHNAVVQNDPVQQTAPYAVGNVELRFVTGRGRFTLQGYVRNVADKSYKVLSQVVSVGAYPTSLGPPRTYGLQFIAKF